MILSQNLQVKPRQSVGISVSIGRMHWIESSTHESRVERNVDLPINVHGSTRAVLPHYDGVVFEYFVIQSSQWLFGVGVQENGCRRIVSIIRNTTAVTLYLLLVT